MPSIFGYLSSRPQPHPRPLQVRFLWICPNAWYVSALEGTPGSVGLIEIGPMNIRLGGCMLHNLLIRRSLPHETQRHSENCPCSLTCLYGARRKALPVSNSLYVVDDWYLGIASKDKIAMHRVNGEVRLHSFLCRCETLSDDCASIHPPGSRWVP